MDSIGCLFILHYITLHYVDHILLVFPLPSSLLFLQKKKMSSVQGLKLTGAGLSLLIRIVAEGGGREEEDLNKRGGGGER